MDFPTKERSQAYSAYYLRLSSLSCPKTPPQSPDLNPVEHIWDVLEKSVRKYDIRNRETLKTVLTRAWSEITPSITENLVMFMPRRLQAAI